MIAGSLARRYARALFDVGQANGTWEKLGAEVQGIAQIFAGSPDLQEALGNPVFGKDRRRAVLEAILGRTTVSPHTRNFLLLLLDRERIAYLPAIARELGTMVDAQAGRVRAEVTSARPLTPDQAAQIQGALERLSGKKVVVEIRQDPDILGGVVAKIGDIVYDGSIRTQLERLRERALHR